MKIKCPQRPLQVFKTGFYKRQYAFAVANQSPLRDPLNEAIVQLRSSGQMEEYVRQWFGEDECLNAGVVNVVPLTAMTMLTAALVTMVLLTQHYT